MGVCMRKNLLFINLFLITVLALISACKQLNEFVVAQSENDILFTVEDVEAGKEQLMLYDISVAKKKCTDSSCVVWEIVRSAEKTHITPENIVDSTIKYGQQFANMEIRQAAKSLTAGEYVVGATFAVISDNKIVGSKLMSGSFKIRTDRGSNIKLVR